MKLLTLIPLLAAVLSTGCIADRQYRYLAGTNGLRITGPDGTPGTKIKLPGVEVAQAGYKLGSSNSRTAATIGTRGNWTAWSI